MMHRYFMFTPDRRYDNVLFLYEAGYEKNEADAEFGPAKRDFYLLHFILSGAGYFTVGDEKDVHVQKGDVFLIVPHKTTVYRADPNDPYEYFWLGFNGPSAQEIVESMGFTNGNYVVHTNDESLYEKLADICKTPAPDIKKFLSIYSGFYEVLSRLTAENVRFDKREFGKDYALLAAEYIERNYMNELSVQALSEYLNLSRSQVYRVFKKTYKVSPEEYIADFRLGKATNMIKKTNKTIQEIAYQCGYKSVSHFITRYKKKHGITPLRGRRLEEFTQSLYE